MAGFSIVAELACFFGAIVSFDIVAVLETFFIGAAVFGEVIVVLSTRSKDASLGDFCSDSLTLFDMLVELVVGLIPFIDDMELLLSKVALLGFNGVVVFVGVFLIVIVTLGSDTLRSSLASVTFCEVDDLEVDCGLDALPSAFLLSSDFRDESAVVF